MSEPSDTAIAASWRNWAGDQRCRPARIETVGSIEQIAEALARATAGGLPVRVAGSGHSFSDIALTDGVQLRLERLTRVLDVDSSSGLVRVQPPSRSAISTSAWPSTGSPGEPRRRRLPDDRRRDLHRHPRHRRVELFVFPHADVALTRTNNRTDAPPRPRGRLSAYANDILRLVHEVALALAAVGGGDVAVGESGPDVGGGGALSARP